MGVRLRCLSTAYSQTEPELLKLLSIKRQGVLSERIAVMGLVALRFGCNTAFGTRYPVSVERLVNTGWGERGEANVLDLIRILYKLRVSARAYDM
jgi:hypothetical protein